MLTVLKSAASKESEKVSAPQEEVLVIQLEEIRYKPQLQERALNLTAFIRYMDKKHNVMSLRVEPRDEVGVIEEVIELRKYRSSDVFGVRAESPDGEVLLIGEVSLFQLFENNLFGRRHFLPLMGEYELKPGEEDPLLYFTSAVVPNATGMKKHADIRLRAEREQLLKDLTVYGEEMAPRVPPNQLREFARLYRLPKFDIEPHLLGREAYNRFQAELANRVQEGALLSRKHDNQIFRKTALLVQQIKLHKKHLIFGTMPIYSLRRELRGLVEELSALGFQKEFRLQIWEGMLDLPNFRRRIDDEARYYLRRAHDAVIDLRYELESHIARIDPVLLANLSSDIAQLRRVKQLPRDAVHQLQRVMLLYLSFATIVKAKFCYMYSDSLLHIALALTAIVEENRLRTHSPSAEHSRFEQELTLRTFWLLLGFVERVCPELYRAELSRGFFMDSRPEGYRKRVCKAKMLLEQKEAELNFKLNKVGCDFEHLLAGGVVTLMADRLAFTTLFRLWDLLICESMYKDEQEPAYLEVACAQFAIDMGPFMQEQRDANQFKRCVEVNAKLLVEQEFIQKVLVAKRHLPYLDTAVQCHLQLHKELFAETQLQNKAVANLLRQVYHQQGLAAAFLRRNITDKIPEEHEVVQQLHGLNESKYRFPDLYESKPRPTCFHLQIMEMGCKFDRPLVIEVEGAEKRAFQVPIYQVEGKYLRLGKGAEYIRFVIPGSYSSKHIQLKNYRLDCLAKDIAMLAPITDREVGYLCFAILPETNLRREGRRPPAVNYEPLIDNLSDYKETKDLRCEVHQFSEQFELLRSAEDYPRLQLEAINAVEPEWSEHSSVSVEHLKEVFLEAAESIGKRQLRLCWSTVYKEFGCKNLFGFRLGAFFIALVLQSKLTKNAKALMVYTFFSRLVPMNESNVSSLLRALEHQYLLFSQSQTPKSGFLRTALMNHRANVVDILQSYDCVNRMARGNCGLLFSSCKMADLNLRGKIEGTYSRDGFVIPFGFDQSEQEEVYRASKEAGGEKSICSLSRLVLPLAGHQRIVTPDQFVDLFRQSAALSYFEGFESTLLSHNMHEYEIKYGSSDRYQLPEHKAQSLVIRANFEGKPIAAYNFVIEFRGTGRPPVVLSKGTPSKLSSGSTILDIEEALAKTVRKELGLVDIPLSIIFSDQEFNYCLTDTMAQISRTQKEATKSLDATVVRQAYSRDFEYEALVKQPDQSLRWRTCSWTGSKARFEGLQGQEYGRRKEDVLRVAL